jgi:hypothetical protein
MKVASVLSFVCFTKDEPFEIQLEPEAIIFKVLPGNELTFKGIPSADISFTWAVSIDYQSRVTQLFPEGWPYEIEIFENGVLLQDWYKYM